MSSLQQHTQSSLSEHNRSSIIRYLYMHGICSRAQVASALHLTPAAITKITARLLDHSIIKETGNLEGKKNRRSIGIGLNYNKFHIIAVKFARTLIEIGIFDFAGNCIKQLPTIVVANDTVKQAVNEVHATIKKLIQTDSKIVAVGIAVPGPYLKKAGYIAIVSSMPEWQNINFNNEFNSAYDVPVFIEQDARAGALAESLFNKENNSQSLAYYLLGEGIGVGVIDNNHILLGYQGAISELGHVSIDINGKPCECGNKGCLERYCSAPTLHQLINEAHIINNSEHMEHYEVCQEFFKLVNSNEANTQAQEIFRNLATNIGYGCIMIINAFNPKRIILGDIIAQAGQPLLQIVKEVVHSRVIKELDETTEIVLSTLRSDTALSGAAAIAISQFINKPSRFIKDFQTNSNNKQYKERKSHD
ncbi:MAG: ROK family transcriptional regulator [Bifidobacteriaceae bacterium]|nr:ROK family transcriptional regulator [Bifidobacteriaceae bacterium]